MIYIRDMEWLVKSNYTGLNLIRAKNCQVKKYLSSEKCCPADELTGGATLQGPRPHIVRIPIWNLKNPAKSAGASRTNQDDASNNYGIMEPIISGRQTDITT